MKSIRPEDIQKQVDDALSAYGRNLSSIEKKMLQEIELLIKELDVDSSGRLKITASNMKKVTSISKKLEKIVLNKSYIKDTSSFISAFKKNSMLQDMMYNQKRTSAMNDLEQMSIDMVADNLTESGVRANIVNPIKKMLLQNITSGGSYSDLTTNLRQMLIPPDGEGIVTKYVKTYALDSINSFSANYNSIISDKMGYEWFAYTGSLIETSREFCVHMVEKKYFHISEIPEILKGHIDNHECELSPRTGLPKGMKKETTKENFHQLRGGWNCGHQIVGVPDAAVPKAIRDRIVYPQKHGIKKVEDTSGILYSDVTGFADFSSKMGKKVSEKVKKQLFNHYLKNNEHKVYKYKKGNVYAMSHAEFNDTEFHVAEKLAKAGYHVVFPNQSDLGKGRKNDVFVYDTKTYFQRRVEIKSLFGDTADTVKKQIISGTGQAGIIAYDIQSGIKRNWLIKGLREGWSKDTKSVLVNWKGQWYEIDKEDLFSQDIYKTLP